VADQKISAMTPAASLADSDELVLASSGTNKKITGANLKASIPGTGGGAGALTLLSTTTLGSAGSFDVTGISQAYNDLTLVLIGRGADPGGVDTALIRFNNDSGNNYYRQRLTVNAGTATASENQGQTGLFSGGIPASAAYANTFGVLEMTIYGYASTAWKKACQFQSFGPLNISAGSLYLTALGGMWDSTAAITRVAMLGSSTANFVTGSQLRIYGRL
jgi:hypothetical protein